MNFIFDYLLTDGQRERLEKAEAKAAKAIKKEYDAMKAAAAVYQDETGDELAAIMKAAEEAEKDPKSEYQKHAAKLAALEEKRDKTRFTLYGDFMREYLATVGTDPAEILADFSDRVKLFIDASEETDPEAIRAAITSELLPYYAEALANTGTENAVTQLHNIVIAQLHNAGKDPETLAEIMQPKPPLYSLAIMQDKLSRTLSKPGRPLEFAGYEEEANGQLKMVWDVENGLNKENEPIYTIAILHTEKPATSGSINISFIERKIIEIVGNELRNHKNTPAGRIGSPLYITPARLWLTLTGKANENGPGGVHASQLDAMKRIMDKLRFMRVSLDFRDELNAKMLPGNDERIRQGIYDTYAIKADFVSVTTSRNQHVEAYRIDGVAPINYIYAAEKKQLSFIRFELVDVSEAFKSEIRTGRVASDPETIAIKFYLLESIYAMYNGFRDNPSMLYETIFTETGTAPRDQFRPENYTTPEAYGAAVRRQEKRLRDRVAAMLEYWTQKGFIKGFLQGKTTDGRKLAGVTVLLYDKNPYPVKKKK